MLGGKAVFCADQLNVALSHTFDAIKEGKKVICGIRPSDVSVDKNGSILGEVKLAEKTGADIQLHLQVKGQNFTAVVARETNVKVGENLKLGVSPELAHIFDADTELRINGHKSD